MPVTMITGASSGFGAALARRFASDGDSVALLARRLEKLEQLAGEIEDAGGTARPIRCDVTDKTQVRDAVDECTRELGPIDRLIANAGTSRETPATRFSADDVEHVMRVNFSGAIYFFEAVLPDMIERRSGHIVGISSIASFRGLPGFGAYCASKAALSQMLESLRIDLTRYDVDVTTIHPGFVRTPLTEGNEFTMPFLLELDDAADRMFEAITARRRVFDFPWQVAVPARLGRLVPSGIYDRVLATQAGTKKKR